MACDPSPGSVVQDLELRAPTALDRAAALILTRHPRVAARYGPCAAHNQVTAALLGITVAGGALPDPGKLTGPDVDALLARLTVPGVNARFSALLAPVLTVPTGVGTRGPFAHVTPGQRAGCRSGYAAWLGDRIAATRPEIRLTPPQAGGVPVAGGCLAYGVATVTRTAAQVGALNGRDHAARAVWTPVLTSQQALGGGLAPAPLSGHFCDVCAQCVGPLGVGVTAMLRCYVQALRAQGHADDAARVENAGGVDNLTGWGAVAASAVRRGHPAPAPNAQAWGHVHLAV